MQVVPPSILQPAGSPIPPVNHRSKPRWIAISSMPSQQVSLGGLPRIGCKSLPKVLRHGRGVGREAALQLLGGGDGLGLGGRCARARLCSPAGSRAGALLRPAGLRACGPAGLRARGPAGPQAPYRVSLVRPAPPAAAAAPAAGTGRPRWPSGRRGCRARRCGHGSAPRSRRRRGWSTAGARWPPP